MGKLKNLILGTVLAATMGCAINRPVSTEYSIMQDWFDHASEITYTIDRAPGEMAKRDTWQTPGQTAMRMRGDCEDRAFYLWRRLTRQGIISRPVFGYMSEESRQRGLAHVWVEAEIEGRLYLLDPGRDAEIISVDEVKEGEYIEDADSSYWLKGIVAYLPRLRAEEAAEICE